MRRIAFYVGAAALAVVPAVVLAQAQARPAAPPPAAANGRFVMMSPPGAAQGNSAMDNFLWVLDTQTGQVAAHRIMQVKNDKGELSYWAYEELVDYDALVARRLQQQAK